MEIKIWEIRNKKGFSLIALAKLTGIGKSTLDNFENGKTTPNMVQMENIAIVLDVSINDLFESDRKLKEYTNLNLTPTQLQEIDKLYAEKCKEVSKLEVYKDVINCFLNNEDVEIWIVWEDLKYLTMLFRLNF